MSCEFDRISHGKGSLIQNGANNQKLNLTSLLHGHAYACSCTIPILLTDKSNLKGYIPLRKLHNMVSLGPCKAAIVMSFNNGGSYIYIYIYVWDNGKPINSHIPFFFFLFWEPTSQFLCSYIMLTIIIFLELACTAFNLVKSYFQFFFFWLTFQGK